MDEFNRADVDAARRLRHEQKLRINFELATDNEFLLVASRKCFGRQRRVWWSNVKLLDDFVSALLNSAFVQEYSSWSSDNWFPIMDTQDRILRQTKIQQQTATMTVFRNVRDSQLATGARPNSG